MATGRTPYLKEAVDLEKPLRDCDGVGEIASEENRTINDLARQVTAALLDVARISGGSFEVLIGVQQAMNRTSKDLIADPETKALGEALQRLALRIHVGAGNPPKQRTERMEEAFSSFNTELWHSLDFSVRTSNAVENFLAKKFGVEKKDLTVRNFFDAFSKEGRFDSSEFRTTKGIGDATFDEFIDILKEKSVITEDLHWNPSFLEKHSLKE